MNGIKVNKDSDGNVREVRYLTDDRDARRRLELVIGWGNNGDWYIVTVPEGERHMSAVRLCTSGGAASDVPGLTVLVARMFRLLASAGSERDPFIDELVKADAELAALTDGKPLLSKTSDSGAGS